jgi:predicted AlkP superfamily pyrophosphatase or phosphodiesterase
MDDTKKIIHHSNVHSALSKEDRNLKVDLLNDNSFVANPILKSRHDSPDHLDHGEGSEMPVIDPEDLVGCTFLMDKQEDRTQFCAHIVHAIKDHGHDLANHPDCIKFLCSVNDNELEEIVSYNKLVSKLSLADDDDGSKVWKFCHITAHQGLLRPSDKD